MGKNWGCNAIVIRDAGQCGDIREVWNLKAYAEAGDEHSDLVIFMTRRLCIGAHASVVLESFEGLRGDILTR